MTAHSDDHPRRGGMTWPPATPFATVLERAQAMDRAAIGLLYQRFLPVVYRYALARVGETHAAEDVTSETFFAMIEGIGTVRAENELAFAAWLLGIARNQVATHFRRGRARQAEPLPDESGEHPAMGEEGDPLKIITAREGWREVVAALDQLTEEQRAVVLYRCVLGYSADEVGTLLGKNAGTIRALQFRALHSLARLLGTSAAESMTRRVAGRRRGDASRA